MSFRDKASAVFANMAREMREKAPAAVASAFQEIRENLPLYDQGHAARSQSAQQATNIHSMNDAEKRAELADAIDQHIQKSSETRENTAKERGPVIEH